MPTTRRTTRKPTTTPKVDMTPTLALRVEIVADLTDTPKADVSVVTDGPVPVLEAAGCKFVVKLDTDDLRAAAAASSTLLMPETLSVRGPNGMRAMVVAEPPRMGVAAMRFSAELVKGGQSGRVLLDTERVKALARAHGGRVYERLTGASVRFPDGSKLVFELTGEGIYDAAELHFPDGEVEYMGDDDAELAPTGATLH